MRGDTSNPNSITKHPQMGGDTLNPKIPTLMTQQKLPTLQGGGKGGDISNPHI